MEQIPIDSNSMQELIRKYQEEAMQYQKRSTDLYREEIPAKEVMAKTEMDELQPPEGAGEIEQPFHKIETLETPESTPTGTAQQQEGSFEENGMEGIGDILYAPGPLSPGEVIQDSHFSLRHVPYTDEGQLQIEISAAERSLPIPFADIMVVRLEDDGRQMVRQLQTDDSGNSPVIELPAPPRILSEAPGDGEIPYGVYTVAVSHPYYYTTIVRDVQIFAGQRALLPVTMIPLTEKATNLLTPNRNIETGNHSLVEDQK